MDHQIWDWEKCCPCSARLFEAILPPPTALGLLFLNGIRLTSSCKELSPSNTSIPLWFVLSFGFWEINIFGLTGVLGFLIQKIWAKLMPYDIQG